MAKTKYIFEWTKSKEGGLSRAKSDDARKNAAPCTITYKGITANDWHTNKGIQWITFKNLASRCGYDPSCQLFADMPENIWYCIAKRGYWDFFNLDDMKSQAIANLLFQSVWGSGPYALEFWNSYFKTDFTYGGELMEYLDDKVKKEGESKLFTRMWQHRLNWLLSRAGNEANYSGWKNRAESLYELSMGKTPKTKNLMEGYSLVDKLMAAGFVWIGFQVGKRIF